MARKRRTPVFDVVSGVALVGALLVSVASRTAFDGSWSPDTVLSLLAVAAVSSLLALLVAAMTSRWGRPPAGRRSLLLRFFVACLLVAAVLLLRHFGRPDQPVPLRVVGLTAGALGASVVLWLRRVPPSPLGAREAAPDLGDPHAEPDDAPGPDASTMRRSQRTIAAAGSAGKVQIVGVLGMVIAASVAVAFGGPVSEGDIPHADSPSPGVSTASSPTQPGEPVVTAPPDLPLMIDDPPIDPALLGTLRFTDVSSEAGLMEAQPGREVRPSDELAGGASAVDYDSDGWVDIFLPRSGLPDVLYRNRGDGTFADVTASAGLGNPKSGTGSSVATWGDVDGDGDPDVLVESSEGARTRLYQNNGDGTFRDFTEGSGIISGSFVRERSLRYGSTFGDIDRDGDLDLVSLGQGSEDASDVPVGAPCVGAEGRIRERSRSPSGSRNRILINDGSGHFADRTTTLLPDFGGPVGFTPVMADLDGDGWLDLLVTGDFCTSRVYRNEYGQGFADITHRLGVGTDENGMGSAVEDFDGDGRLDWFVTSISYPSGESGCDVSFGAGCSGNRLYLNVGDQGWRDATDEYGVRHGKWGWGIAATDFDNDGDRDLAMVNGFRSRDPLPDGSPLKAESDYWLENETRLWLNTGSLPLTQAANAAGLTSRGLAKSAVPFDYDRDGDLDLLISHTETPPVLYRNDLANGNSWVRLDLEDPDSGNKAGVGAHVEIRVTPSGSPQVTEIRTSGTYGGSVPPTAHFGLGPGIDSIAEIVVRWPDGRRITRLTDVPVNRVIEIRPSG